MDEVQSKEGILVSEVLLLRFKGWVCLQIRNNSTYRILQNAPRFYLKTKDFQEILKINMDAV
jgi:hypothetical protein